MRHRVRSGARPNPSASQQPTATRRTTHQRPEKRRQETRSTRSASLRARVSVAAPDLADSTSRAMKRCRRARAARKHGDVPRKDLSSRYRRSAGHKTHGEPTRDGRAAKRAHHSPEYASDVMYGAPSAGKVYECRCGNGGRCTYRDSIAFNTRLCAPPEKASHASGSRASASAYSRTWTPLARPNWKSMSARLNAAAYPKRLRGDTVRYATEETHQCRRGEG